MTTESKIDRNQVSNRRWFISISAALLILAGLFRFWIAPLLERLPADYSSETLYVDENSIRHSLSEEWRTDTLIAQRIDQVISVSNTALIIQGGLYVYYADGSLNFETSSIYGVDHRTRMNMPGLGDISRTGQFLFPLHVKQTTYTFWDPIYIGLRTVTFDRAEEMDGMRVYVFHFTALNLDETKGFDYLPDVPERYLAITNGEGTLWIEPLSGIVVDYRDQGRSTFVDKVTKAPEGDFSRWVEYYTPETRAAQLELARIARLRILVLEAWLPGGLLLASLVCFGIGFWPMRRLGADKR